MKTGRGLAMLVGGLLLTGVCTAPAGAVENGPGPNRRAPAVTGPAGTATLRLYLRDQPNPAVRTGRFTLHAAAVHRSGHGWYPLQEKQLLFEFSSVAGEELLVGEIQVPPGDYDRLRLAVSGAAVEIGGRLQPVTAACEAFALQRKLELCAGETEIVIDLGARRSLAYQPTDASYQIRPQPQIAELASSCRPGGGILVAGGNRPLRSL